MALFASCGAKSHAYHVEIVDYQVKTTSELVGHLIYFVPLRQFSAISIELMILENPIRWTDPGTWPWFFYGWIALFRASGLKPLRRWIRAKSSKPLAQCDGRNPICCSERT